MPSSSEAHGKDWERDFVALAQESGYSARRVSGDRAHDAVVNGLKVQCKSITYERKGTVRIGKSYGKGTRRYRRSDFDVLALNFRGTVFLIPAASACGVEQRWPQSIRLSRNWRYRNKWDVFDRGTQIPVEHQRSLFEVI